MQFIEDNSIQFSFGVTEENELARSLELDNARLLKINLVFKPSIDYHSLHSSHLDSFEATELCDVFVYFDTLIKWMAARGFNEDDVDEFEEFWLRFKKRWSKLYHENLIEIKYDSFECDDAWFPYIRAIMDRHMMVTRFIPEGHEMCAKISEASEGTKVELCYRNVENDSQ